MLVARGADLRAGTLQNMRAAAALRIGCAHCAHAGPDAAIHLTLLLRLEPIVRAAIAQLGRLLDGLLQAHGHRGAHLLLQLLLLLSRLVEALALTA